MEPIEVAMIVIPRTLLPDGRKEPTYVSWSRMKQRVKRGYARMEDPRWQFFFNFVVDMGIRPPGKTLDRIDNARGYFKENCRWATAKEQQNNRTNNVRKRYVPLKSR